MNLFLEIAGIATVTRVVLMANFVVASDTVVTVALVVAAAGSRINIINITQVRNVSRRNLNI